MTTMDVVVSAGGRPANFLEIGGEAYTKAKVALEILLKNPNIRSLLVNFCGAFARTDVMAEEHPELVVTYMKAMIKVGRWANEHKHAAAAILDKQTFYLDVEDTYRGIGNVDMVPDRDYWWHDLMDDASPECEPVSVDQSSPDPARAHPEGAGREVGTRLRQIRPRGRRCGPGWRAGQACPPRGRGLGDRR